MFQKLLLLTALTAFGGWATVSVEDLPERLIAGRPTTLAFIVRQHGVHPLDGLHPRLDARGPDGASVQANATPAGTGRYSATFTIPATGDWTITIESGFGTSRAVLAPIAAIGNAASTAPVPASIERGRRLFQAKGCVGCHTYEGLSDGRVGPELTNLRLTADYVSRFLADPEKVAAGRTFNGNTMPNLDLKPTEIAALTAFLTREGASGN